MACRKICRRSALKALSSDPGLAKGLITRDGEVLNEGVAAALRAE